MGFHSKDCEGCGHPMLCAEAIGTTESRWMNECVAITETGSVIHGAYDGYGRLFEEFTEVALPYEVTVWHEACWELAGKPTDYRGISADSADQGWFFEDGAHNLPDPRTASSSSTS